MGSYKYCLFFKRTFGWSEARPPDDVKTLFEEYCEGGSQMSMEQFKKFLVGRDNPNNAHKIFEWIQQQKSRTTRISRSFILLDDLQTYLFSNELNPSLKHQVLF